MGAARIQQDRPARSPRIPEDESETVVEPQLCGGLKASGAHQGIIHLIEVKPAVGFTLPSAGVTPAPSVKENREMSRTTFRSGGLAQRKLPRPLFYGKGGRR